VKCYCSQSEWINFINNFYHKMYTNCIKKYYAPDPDMRNERLVVLGSLFDIEELEEILYKPNPYLSMVPIEQNTAIKTSGVCAHSWKQYQGLIESYQYCIKCDKKENE
jgi:hypothetical protein